MTSSVATDFAQFCVVSVRKCMVKKYLISDRFSFTEPPLPPLQFDIDTPYWPKLTDGV